MKNISKLSHQHHSRTLQNFLPQRDKNHRSKQLKAQVYRETASERRREWRAQCFFRSSAPPIKPTAILFQFGAKYSCPPAFDFRVREDAGELLKGQSSHEAQERRSPPHSLLLLVLLLLLLLLLQWSSTIFEISLS